jgi:uncharacterized DUF497 family protein
MKDDFDATEYEGFDWDDSNAPKNWITHNVLPTECEQIFFNRPLQTSHDEKHSQHEKRYYCLGRTDMGRRLFISFTVRGKRIRVISARDMSRKERTLYNEKDNS